IYSVAGKMTPMGDFRPASPDSFEDDYDDVSLSESDRGHKPPPASEDLQSQKSKAGTESWDFSPISSMPLSAGDPVLRGGSGRSRCMTSVIVLYVLVALSFIAWLLLFTLAVVKQMEIMEELKLLRLNHSGNQANVWQGLSETQQEQRRLRSVMRRHDVELHDIAVLICRSIPDSKKCSAGWKTFDKSCYSFSMETASWSAARDACVEQGAHLVTVNSDLEQVGRTLA
ncbi:CL17A protein, partial [Anhinga rufa]|nr:CL17A protein [Anhinga rufa]